MLRLPDALSRRSDYSPSEEHDEKVILLPDTLFASAVDIAIADALRLSDPLSDPIIRLAADALAGHISPPARSILADWRMEDDVLYYRNRAYVPPSARHHLVSLHHETSTSGHPGRFITEDLIKRDYWWPSMSSYIAKYVEGCAICQQMKADTHPSAPRLHPISSDSTRPYSQISVDLITDLPLSNGFDSIMVVVDHGLSKGVTLSACNKTITAEGVADLFLERVFTRFGLPDKIISDRGPQFASKFTIELGKLLGYKNALSVAYHPQTDGQTERLNQELETYLRIYCRTDPHSWSKHLALAEFTHNHRTHSTQKSSPFFLLYGYEPRALPSTLSTSPVPAVEERIKKLQAKREEAQACHNIAARRMADRTFHSKFVPWKKGDKVWLSAKNLMVPVPSKKLAPKRYGPFVIEKVISALTYTLKLPPQWKIHSNFHATELSSYRENEIHGPNFTEPPPDVIDNEEEFEVEAIRAHKRIRSKLQYLVSWKGYPSSNDEWVPETNLKHAIKLLKAYKKTKKL
jgi:hypothetical protein